jgi:hypothetical protein
MRREDRQLAAEKRFFQSLDERRHTLAAGERFFHAISGTYAFDFAAL